MSKILRKQGSEQFELTRREDINGRTLEAVASLAHLKSKEVGMARVVLLREGGKRYHQRGGRRQGHEASCGPELEFWILFSDKREEKG